MTHLSTPSPSSTLLSHPLHSYIPFYSSYPISTMLRSQPAKNTLRAVQHRHSVCAPHSLQFSTSAKVAAISPYRGVYQQPTSKSTKDAARRGKSTASTAPASLVASEGQTLHCQHSMANLPADQPTVKRDHSQAQHSTKMCGEARFIPYKMHRDLIWTIRKTMLHLNAVEASL